MTGDYVSCTSRLYLLFVISAENVEYRAHDM